MPLRLPRQRVQAAADRYLITAIELKLPLLHDLRMDYAGIREELQAQGVELPSAVDVANAVIAIRRRKLPDPEVLGNAGSFFKNPVLPLEQVDVLLQHFPDLPVFPAEQDDRRKVSAAWMIESCGWKGFREGDAGVAPSHALVLVNHGNASGAELLRWRAASRPRCWKSSACRSNRSPACSAHSGEQPALSLAPPRCGRRC